MSSRVIHFYRIQPGSGQRLRYRMELDGSNTVISEALVSEPRSRSELPDRRALRVHVASEEVPAVHTARSAHLAQLASRGMQFNVSPEGTIELLSVPPLEQAIHKFFIEAVPCWFDGCEQLRQDWAEFLSINGGEEPDCPDCVKGQLMEQFRDRIEPLITRHLHGSPTQSIR
jgi:hypothetical protein